MKTTKQAGWIFKCPKHGIEHGLFCSNAYKSSHEKFWQKVEIVYIEKKTYNNERREWQRIMNLTRQYNGVLPE